jgi:ATP-dependent exoDNAse (exonuclease V) alpha subunit
MVSVPKFEKSDLINLINSKQYIHIGGSAGTGKTHILKMLSKIYQSAGICATTHQAAKIINGKTFYSELNIKNDRPTYIKPIYFIDECSMLSAENLLQIINKAPLSKIVIFGDFSQLPVVDGTPINHSDIYKKFFKYELTKNWRQSEDQEFYELCQKLRGEISNKKALEIIKKLNTRVLEIPEYDTSDDIYICGVNSQCDIINNQFEFSNGCKVIARKNKSNYVNGSKGVLYNDKIKWDDGSITAFQKGDIQKNYACTVHVAQGGTYKRNVIINPTRLFEKNHLYVALTRATKFNSIYLTNPIRLDVFNKTCYVSK